MKRGFYLGKYMPPHRGHLFVCETAMQLVDELTVLVCALPDDPIAGPLRFAWMKEMLPRARVLYHDAVVPQTPAEHPDFWRIWTDIRKTAHPEPIDEVFGSEPYIAKLATVLDARPNIIDPERIAFPTSATAIRSDPYGNWPMIPAPVQRHYQKRVVLMGAESTGKTTLAQALAKTFATRCVPEYGRNYDAVQRHIGWQSDDFDRIATTHRATSLATAPHAGPVLIEDTDPLQTRVWQKHLLDLTELTPNTAQTADLYLLLAPDTPWINDGTRYQETTAKRMGFHTDCLSILRQSGVCFCEISGDWQSRQTAAKAAITDLLTFKGPQT